MSDTVPIDWEARYNTELHRRRNRDRRAARANDQLSLMRQELEKAQQQAKVYRLKYESSLARQLDLLKERLELIQDLAACHPPDDPRGGAAVNAFEHDRSKMSGLHFAQDAMRPHERETLHLGEAMLRRLDAVLGLHWQAAAWEDYPPLCAECGADYPCDTVRAITGEEA